jgi:hypothetical protein
MATTKTEVFTFLMARFNVTKARKLIEEGVAKLVTVNPKELRPLAGFVGTSEDDVRNADVTEPGILVKFLIPQQDAPDEVFTILISGWPQAKKLLADNADSMQVYYFDDPEFVMREIGWMRRPMSLNDPSNDLIDEFEERLGGCGYPG